MRKWLAEVFYWDWKVFATLLYWNLRYFYWKRALIIFGVALILLLHATLSVVLRLLDEVFYPAYRKTPIREPVFIISNPRSGTTYMHRLLCLDEKRFTYFLLYHTFLPSVLFFRFILVLKRLDKKMNWPLRRFFEKVEDRVFEGWKDIHPMGFERSEEDEGLFVLSLMSPAIGLVFPWMKKIDALWIADELPAHKKARMMAYYRNTIQRFLYAWGPDKVFLSKNVISTGRMGMLLETFPDARIIYPVRHPYKTIPSITSMFAAPWKLYAPDIPENSPEYRNWGMLSIRFYQHFFRMMPHLDAERFYHVRYKDFVKNPMDTILDIYRTFGWKPDEDFVERLRNQCNRSRQYRSKHDYTLEQYGYEKAVIEEELREVFEYFRFKKDGVS